jgi:hypothetical protein
LKPQKSNPEERPLSRKKRIVFTTITVLFIFVFCSLVYLGTVIWRSKKHHRWHPRTVGSVYRADKRYGYFPKPNSAAFFTIRGRQRVPLIFDAYGFRVPVRKWQTVHPYRGGILFLGCSFTLGDGVAAENTFPELVGNALDIRGMNAGMSGGGLCQMILRARDEIPRFKPKYVVAQYAIWMVSRSQRYYRPTDYGKTPGPFFYESEGNIDIYPPVFTTINFDVPIAKYARKGLLPFTWHVGLPLYIHDDFYVALTSIRRFLGIIPKPVESEAAVVEYTYKEIEKICRANGARMVILKLYMGLEEMPSYGVETLGIPVVDTLEPLASHLPERTMETWRMTYQFMKGKPPRLVDIHPNAAAHRIIADTVISKIRSLETSQEIPAKAPVNPSETPTGN